MNALINCNTIERLPGEPDNAFHAFRHYCNLGAGRRTLQAAWLAYRTEAGQPATKCPGRWNEWSTTYHWVQRAADYDAQMQEAQHAARLECTRRLESRRGDFESEQQEESELLIREMNRALHEYATAPRTDVVTEQEEIINGQPVRTKTTVKAIGGAEYAALMKQRDQSLRQAIIGVRDKVSDAATDKPSGIVWIRDRKAA